MERIIEWREYNETVIHPVALVFTLAMGIWLVQTRRERAVLPFLLVACLIPVAQRVVIGTLDFNMSRILILFGWTRLLMRNEVGSFTWSRLDSAFCAWLALGTLTHVARELSVGALVYRLGVIFDACGIYFMLRMLLRSSGEVFRGILNLAGIACVVGFFMIIENLTGRNYFSVFGGVHEYTQLRYGRLRCQGAFSHPIMAGSFGAGLLPLLTSAALISRSRRFLAAAGVVASFVIVLTSASSGPVLALIGAFVGGALFFVRQQMRWILRGGVAMLLLLHVIREQPVWHLIGRASDLIGGTGYHRVRLINAFVDHWREWFLVGTSSTAHWGWGLQDITNHFVLQGVRGGVLTFASFIVLLAISFASVGGVLRRSARASWLPGGRRRRLQIFAWGLGTSLATHCVAWVGVSYFGQMDLILYMLFAFIAALAQTPELRRPERTASQSPLPPEPPQAAPSSRPRGARAWRQARNARHAQANAMLQGRYREGGTVPGG